MGFDSLASVSEAVVLHPLASLQMLPPPRPPLVMNPPLISVITTTFNSGEKIAATVASVLSQRKGLYEFLVVDGGSTDDTLAHLRAQGPALRCLSEPDDGIYDAMNKGIRLTSGKFLYFLGAGDRLLPGVLEAVAAEIRKLSGQGQTARPTLLYGNVDSPLYSRPYDGRFDRFKLLRSNICHQAIFYQRSVFERLGCYNTKYRLLADWEFNIRCFNDRGIRKRYISLRIADYEGGGESITTPDLAFYTDFPLIPLLTHIEFLLYDPRAEQEGNLALALDEAVWRLYEAGSHLPLRWKVTLLKQNCSAKTICLVVCSTCGFSFARFKQILGSGVALKRMIFRARLKLLTSGSNLAQEPHDLFRGIGDGFWFWLNTEGCRISPTLRNILPAMPEEDVQLGFTGNKGDAVMSDGFAAYRLFRNLYEHHVGPIARCGNILDFGCGWGRIIRFFLKDIEPSRLLGVDPVEEMVALCKQQNRWCAFERIPNVPPSHLKENTFELIYSFSVFSHLSEEMHNKVLAELSRLLKPGGLLVVTTWGREFIEAAAAMRKRADLNSLHPGPRSSGTAFPETQKALLQYDRGDYCFAAQVHEWWLTGERPLYPKIMF